MDYKLSDIDEGIRDLVELINKIPFIETTSSCEGHMEDPYNRDSPVTPDIEKVLIRSGSLLFYIDGQLDASKPQPTIDHFNHPLAKEFLGRLEKLTEKYSFTEFRLLSMYHARELRPEYEFRVWDDEIVPYSVGVERKKQMKKVWPDFEQICGDFIDEFNL